MNVTTLLALAESRHWVCYDGTVETRSHWCNLRSRPLLGVDFHHTISTRCGACEPMDLGHISAGPPQEGVQKALALLSQFFEIEVFTGYSDKFNRDAKSDLKQYLDKHSIYYDTINNTKPSFMFQIDDRGVRHRSWQDTLREIAIRSVRSEEVYL